MNHIGTIIVLSALLFIRLPADNPQPQISVNGTAAIQVEPDRMNWQLEVRAEDKQPAEAAKKHDQTVETLLKYLKKAGIKKESIRLGEMEFGENMVTNGQKQERQGYYARSSLSLVNTEPSDYRELYSGLAAISLVSLEYVSYDTSRRIELRNEIRQKALQAAHAKAEAMAKTLGVAIGGPISIEEQAENWNTYDRSANVIESVPVSDDENGSIIPGRLCIREHVKVTFALVPKR